MREVGCFLRAGHTYIFLLIPCLFYLVPLFPLAKAVMSIVRKKFNLPKARGFKILSFATEEEVVTNLDRINRNNTFVNPCLKGGAGNIYVIW